MSERDVEGEFVAPLSPFFELLGLFPFFLVQMASLGRGYASYEFLNGERSAVCGVCRRALLV